MPFQEWRKRDFFEGLQKSSSSENASSSRLSAAELEPWLLTGEIGKRCERPCNASAIDSPRLGDELEVARAYPVATATASRSRCSRLRSSFIDFNNTALSSSS